MVNVVVDIIALLVVMLFATVCITVEVFIIVVEVSVDVCRVAKKLFTWMWRKT